MNCRTNKHGAIRFVAMILFHSFLRRLQGQVLPIYFFLATQSKTMYYLFGEQLQRPVNILNRNLHKLAVEPVPTSSLYVQRESNTARNCTPPPPRYHDTTDIIKTQKQDKDRREGKGRRGLLGDVLECRNNHLPVRMILTKVFGIIFSKHSFGQVAVYLFILVENS